MNVIIDTSDILKLIPHRDPIRLIDGVLNYEQHKRIVATFFVSENSSVFDGHFPLFPLMPGVLIVEALAQTGAVFMALEDRHWQIGQKLEKIANISMLGVLGDSKIRFKKPVFPSTQMLFEAEVDWQIKNSLCIKVKASDANEGHLFASGQLTLSSVPLSILEQHKHFSSKQKTIL